MSALHPILDRLGRDFGRILAPEPPPEPQPDPIDDAPADMGEVLMLPCICTAQVCVGVIFWTGHVQPWVWIAGALVALGAVIAKFWPTPKR